MAVVGQAASVKKFGGNVALSTLRSLDSVGVPANQRSRRVTALRSFKWRGPPVIFSERGRAEIYLRIRDPCSLNPAFSQPNLLGTRACGPP